MSAAIDYGSDASDDGYNKPATGYCSRLCSEFTVPMFGIFDAPTGKKLDLEESFAANGSKYVIALKVVIWALIVQTLVWTWLESAYPGFYLAYLTNWGLVTATIYQTISVLISLGRDGLGMLKTAWALFPLVANSQLLIVIVYWVILFDDQGVTYLNVMKHGVVFLIIFLDGLVLSRVPVRLKHVVFTFLYAGTYIAWSAIHAFVLGENPYKDDEDDDAIYSFIKWNTEPASTAIFLAILWFGVVPLFHVIIWGLSLCGRRYQ